MFQPPSVSSAVFRSGWVTTKVVSGVRFQLLSELVGAGVIIGAAATATSFELR